MFVCYCGGFFFFGGGGGLLGFFFGGVLLKFWCFFFSFVGFMGFCFLLLVKNCWEIVGILFWFSCSFFSFFYFFLFYYLQIKLLINTEYAVMEVSIFCNIQTFVSFLFGCILQNVLLVSFKIYLWN